MKRWLSGSVVALALGAMGLVSAGCNAGQQYVVRGQPASVGVDGTVTVTESQEGINLLNIKLVHLPPPDRHELSHTVFVVWVTPNEGGVLKAGRLAYDPDDREGTMEATTPYPEVMVTVTSEQNYQVTKPTGKIVIMTKPVRSEPKVITQRAGAGDEG